MSVPLWEPGTQYNYGDIVEYRMSLSDSTISTLNSHRPSLGIRYKTTQPHRSQVTETMHNSVWSSSYRIIQRSWAPPGMPILWTRIPESEWHNHESYNPPHEKGIRSFISAVDQTSSFCLLKVTTTAKMYINQTTAVGIQIRLS